ncbi:hypothetical protein, partial [Salmonella sp. s57610]|uniref:hypothetical protein n=1 Tax=Salmonella sp. s57610 TaxID=3159697 RepID=UPI00397F2EE5
ELLIEKVGREERKEMGMLNLRDLKSVVGAMTKNQMMDVLTPMGVQRRTEKVSVMGFSSESGCSALGAVLK